MFARIQRMLRWSLFMLGILALIWLPLSPLFHGQVVCFRDEIQPGGGYSPVLSAYSFDAKLVFNLQGGVRPWPIGVDVYGRYGLSYATYWSSLRNGLEPGVGNDRDSGIWVDLPLWVLAVICLAWPLTSLVLARRRRKRGFPVEPMDASDSEAPKVRSNEAQGASPG